MAKGIKGLRRFAFRQLSPSPYSFTSRNRGVSVDLYPKRCSKSLDKKDWEDTICSVCLECPHNAVLLLCSSHNNGCRPYMCGTSFRYSNCFDQYKKFYTKVVPSSEEDPLLSSIDDSVLAPSSGQPVKKCEVMELACPLCRGLVKGWTVVEPARECLNSKKRSCMQDGCTFDGTFKELRKHMRSDHPCAQPREVDPILEQRWKRFVQERAQEEATSIIRWTMQGEMYFGDHHGFGTDDGINADAAERSGGFESGLDHGNSISRLLHAFDPSGNDLGRQARQPTHAADENAVGAHHTSLVGLSDLADIFHDNDVDGGNIPLVSRMDRILRYDRLLSGLSGRRRRQREAAREQTRR